MRINRIGRQEPGVGQQIPERSRIEQYPRGEPHARSAQTLRGADPGEQRGRGGDHHPDSTGCEPVERPRSRGRDIKVRSQAAVRINFV